MPLATLCLASALLASEAYAAWDTRPVIKAGTQYNDNVPLGEPNDGGMVSSVSAQVTARWLAEKNRFDLTVGGDFTDYQGVERYDNNSAQFLRLDARRGYQRGAIGIQVGGRQDDYRQIYNVISQGDSIDVDDGVFLDENSDTPLGSEVDVNREVTLEQIDRTTIYAKPYMEYQFSRRNLGRVFFEYSSLDVDSTGEQLGLVDSERTLAGVSFESNLSQRNAIGVDISVGELSPDNRDDFDSTEIRLGWSHQASEGLEFNVYGGAREVDSNRANADKETGALVRIEVQHKTQTSRLRASVERSLFPSAYGRIIEGDTLRFNYRKDLTRRFSFAFSLNAADIAPDDQTNIEDDRSFIYAEPEFSWLFTETVSLSLAYSYRWTERAEDQLRGIDRVDGHAVMLGLEYHPLRRY